MDTIGLIALKPATGVHLRVYLFSQVAYNYIPVDLYP